MFQVQFAGSHPIPVFAERKLCLDQNKSRTNARSPSLLADPAPATSAPPAAGERMISGNAGDGVASASPMSRPPSRRRLWLLLGVLVAVVLVAWLISALWDSGPSSRSANRADAMLPVSTTATGQAVRGGHAVILPEQPGNGAASVIAGTAAGSLPAATASTASSQALESLAASVATTNDGAGASHAVSRHRHAHQDDHPADADVTLLTALIQHVENAGPDGWKKAESMAPYVDPVAVDMKDCPAANTRAGIECRQKICEKHQGESSVCPTPVEAGKSGDDASHESP